MADTKLAALLAIPRVGSVAYDPRWPAVEDLLGLALPGGYKAIVDRFGSSPWGDFLYVLSPFDEQLGLLNMGRRILDADHESRRQFPEHFPLPLYPESGGLLPWAATDNGDTLYFVTAGTAAAWPTIVKGPRAPEFEVHFLSPALIIHHFAAGSLRSSILPQLDAEPLS